MALRKIGKYAACTIWVLLAVSASSHAFQNARVGSAGATVLAKPQPGSKKLATLRAGTILKISDTPTRGFYQVTTSARISGWATEGSLHLPSPPRLPSPPPDTSPQEPLPQAHAPDAVPTHSNPLAPSPEPVAPPQRLSAREEKRDYAGLSLGLGTGGGGKAFVFALESGYELLPPFWSGLYFTYLSLPAVSPTSSIPASNGALMSVAAELNFFPSFLRGAHVGVKGGAGLVSLETRTSATGSAGATSSGNENIFVGVAAAGLGYDRLVWRDFSVGGDLNALYVSDGAAWPLTCLLLSIKYDF